MYSTWNVEALKAKLRERGASLKGRKADLIERLEAYDRNQNFDAVQAEENDDPKWFYQIMMLIWTSTAV
ncbi:hypothetical protein EVAR_62858_1 [Eumeta japonica]|uniref:SAP domain-containing protein n=1 Tax=Eumeta variegata TaxID=151549 RepID=A0A4C2A4H8_EUMVA|nr:hypothetical protein EVAR_62858_1 [Eumeta japonica]